MWIRQLLLAVTGLGAGVTVAGGLFSFIIGLGVISDLADRTHTGNKILLYEDAVALAEVLNAYPIFIRRMKLTSHLSWFILAIALGKTLGALLFFWKRW